MSSLLAAHLNLLVCPVCHDSLRLEGDAVCCTGCLRRYPIVDGLPVLIASRALSSAQVPPIDMESASK